MVALSLFSITVELLRCPPKTVDRSYDGLERVEVGGGLCGVSDLSMAYPPANQIERWALGEPLCLCTCLSVTVSYPANLRE